MFHPPSRKTTKRSPDSPQLWIPPIPQSTPKLWQFRLITLLAAVVAAGPIVLTFQPLFLGVAHDHKLVSLLIGLVGTIAMSALIAILVRQLPTEIIAIAAIGSLIFSIPAVIWCLSLIVHEQIKAGDPLKHTATIAPRYDITPDVFLATLEFAISAGLMIGLIAAMRRDV
jgi:hypothetical protein